MSNAVTFLSALKPQDFLSLLHKHRAWLTPAQAAECIGVKSRTLESWRAAVLGPDLRRPSRSRHRSLPTEVGHPKGHLTYWVYTLLRATTNALLVRV
jgi:hypothetical protein